MALLPATLLGLVALTWWLPLGLLSGPVSVLLDDGNWAFLAAVLLTLGASVGRLLAPIRRIAGAAGTWSHDGPDRGGRVRRRGRGQSRPPAARHPDWADR